MKPLVLGELGKKGKGKGKEKMEVVEEQPLSPGSRLFLEPNFNCNIIAIMGYGKRIDVGVVMAGLEVTLVRHPRFSSLQVFDEKRKNARWVPTTVEVVDHLVVPDLDAAAIDSPEKFVEDYISGLSKTTLDLSKPLWDLHILNLKTSEAEAVAVLRCHHSLGDGISLMSLLLACFRKTSDPDALPTIPEGRGKGKKKESGYGLWSLLVGFLMLIRTVWYMVADASLFLATSVSLRDTETPIKGKEGVEFNPRRFVHRTITLEDLNTVKRVMGVTINDVLLGVTSAGLTRYLSRRYGPNDSNGKGHLPANIRIRSTVIVNIRKAPGIHALADMMEGGSDHAPWGNCFGYMILPFQIVRHDNPLDYVRAANVIANRKKSSREAFLTSSCAKLVLTIFGIKTAAAITHKVLSNTTLSFSNVVGPLEEVSFYGHPMVYIAPSVYGHPHALTIHFQSYMGKMKIVLAVDESVIPDPHQLCEDLVESFNLIRDAAVSKESAK